MEDKRTAIEDLLKQIDQNLLIGLLDALVTENKEVLRVETSDSTRREQ